MAETSKIADISLVRPLSMRATGMYMEPSSPPVKDDKRIAATAMSQARDQNNRNSNASVPPAASRNAVATRHDASVEEALGACGGGMMGWFHCCTVHVWWRRRVVVA
jgi:hypothetical protein